MTLGPRQGPPPPKTNSLESKEEKKKFIKEILSTLDDDNNTGHLCLDTVKRAIQARVAYQIIKDYESDSSKAQEKYKITGLEGTEDKENLHLDIENIQDVWIPKEIFPNSEKWKKDFCILKIDEANFFSFDPTNKNQEQDQLLADEVLHCVELNAEAKHKFVLGDKLDLLTTNSEWRQAALEYSKMFLSRIKDFGEKMLSREFTKDRLEHFSQDPNKYSNEEENYLKVIKILSSMYLEEVE